MITLTQIAYLACLWPIWREFGWEVFKTIGADRRVKKSYAWFQVFICVLKFGGSLASLASSRSRPRRPQIGS